MHVQCFPCRCQIAYTVSQQGSTCKFLQFSKQYVYKKLPFWASIYVGTAQCFLSVNAFESQFFFMQWQLYIFRVKVCQNIFVMLFLTEVILAKLPNLANWHVLWILPHITYTQVAVPTLAVQGQHKCRIIWASFHI